ncbi:MAG: hypothetical protein EOM26_08605 [Alphaproteobacteria bacterium]|nr:hypothetical protein [Alphaproteobacteria bacterium]
MIEFLGLALDILIVALLAATIFYSIRLSANLKIFRESRGQIANLLEDLSNNIAHAEQAIAGLRETARDGGKELQDTIDKGRALSDELQLVTEAGDNLARRLEKLASQRGRSGGERSSERDEEEHIFADPGLEEIFRKPERPKAKSEPAPSRPARGGAEPLGFAIRDPDFDSGAEPEGMPFDEFLGAGPDEDPGLATQAERDLYSALARKNKAGKKP